MSDISGQVLGLLVLEKQILKGFAIYSHGSHLVHVTWTIPLPNDAPHEVWLCLAERFQRIRSLKLWTDGDRRTDAGEWEYYKLNGSGELIMTAT